MTLDQYEKAAVLLDDLNKLRDARDAINQNISMRESQLTFSRASTLYDWLRKCSGKFSLTGNKAGVAIRAESARTVEFEVDEGFIGTILMYLDAQIDEKEKALSEL